MPCAFGRQPKTSLKLVLGPGPMLAANVIVDLASQPISVNIGPLTGLASYNCRQGWRSWVFQQWLESGRRELIIKGSLKVLTSDYTESCR